MTEPTKPRTALTLKFDEEQKLSIQLWAKAQAVAVDDPGSLAYLIGRTIDEQLAQLLDVDSEPQPEKGAADVKGA